VSDEAWRSDERYRALSGCSATDLAWEFLRRNPDYRSQFNRAREVTSGGPACAEGASWSRWGLSFRRGPGAIGGGATGLLAT